MICSRKNVPTYLLVAAVRTQWTSRDVGSITTWLVFTFTSLVKNNLLTGDQPRVSGGWGLAKWYSLEVFEPTTFSSFRLRTQNHRANILLAKVWLSRSKLGLFDIKNWQPKTQQLPDKICLHQSLAIFQRISFYSVLSNWNILAKVIKRKKKKKTSSFQNISKFWLGTHFLLLRHFELLCWDGWEQCYKSLSFLSPFALYFVVGYEQCDKNWRKLTELNIATKQF